MQTWAVFVYLRNAALVPTANQLNLRDRLQNSPVNSDSISHRAWRRRAVSVLLVVLAVVGYSLASRWVARRIGPPFHIAIDNPAANPPNVILEVTCCRQMEEIVFVHLTGRVRNIGPRPLKMVIAHARYFDHDGHQIASAQSMVSKPVLEPGDKPADFIITTPVNLAIVRATVDFRQPAGPPIPAHYREFGFSLSD